MKKVSNLIGTIALAFVALFTVNVHAEAANVATIDGTPYQDLATAVQNASGKTIVLTDNVELPSTLNISTNISFTIDLKGHKITGPSTGYAIHNANGTLTIQDTGAEKGSITCVATSASCIANDANATMTVDGVTIVNPGVNAGIINRSNANGLTVKDSVITVNKGIGIQNDGKATIQGTTINLKPNTKGVVNAGEATIKDTKIAGPVIGSSVGIDGSTDSINTNAKTTVENVTLTGHSHIKAEATTGNAELIIDGLKGAKGSSNQIQTGQGVTVKPDAENTAQVMKYATSGSKIVVPDDYEGELVQNPGVQYVNNAGTEVVYVTYKGVRYEITKGQNWTTNTTLYNELKKADDFDNKHFVHFENSKGETVSGKNNWDESDTVYAIYTITVTFNENDYTIELGKDGTAVRMGNAVDADGNRLDDAMNDFDTDKYAAANYYDANGDKYSQGTLVDENVVITETTYTIHVTLNGSTISLTAGDKVSDSNTLKEEASKDHFYYFVDEEGNKYSLNSVLSQNVKLTAIYSVTVKVAGVDGVSEGVGYTVEEGTTLGDILKESWGKGLKAYLDAEGFVKFVDEDGNEVKLTDPITSDMNLRAIYSVTVKVAGVDGVSKGVGYTVEEGTTLGDILKESWGTGLQAYLDAEGFVKFVDEDGNEVKLDTPITSDMNLRAIFSVTVRVAGVDGVSEGVGYTVEEGTTLRDILKETWGTGLQAYLDAEGFIGFFDEEGHMVGLDDAINSSVNLRARFLRQPDLGQETDPEFGKPIPENPETLDAVATSVAMMLGSLVAMIALAFSSKKLFN